MRSVVPFIEFGALLLGATACARPEAPRIIALPAAAASPPSALIAIEHRKLDGVATHVDPRGERFAVCVVDCDVWDRHGAYRGSVTRARCGDWRELNGHVTEQEGYSSTWTADDPIVHREWGHRDLAPTDKLDCKRDEFWGPDGEAGGDGCRWSEPPRVVASNAAGTAFAVVRSEGLPHAMTTTLEIVRLRPTFARWQVRESYGHQALAVALSADGRRAVVFASETDNSDDTDDIPRKPSIVLAVEAAAPRALDDSPARSGADTFGSASLTASEDGAVFERKGDTPIFVPLDGSKARALSPEEQAAASHKLPEEQGLFSTLDGDLFVRASDGAEMREDGCWLPEPWRAIRLSELEVFEGDPFDATRIDPKRLAAAFCGQARFDAFLRGAPMAARPPPIVPSR